VPIVEAKVDKKRPAKDQEIEHVHRTKLDWQPPSAFDGIDDVVTIFKNKFIKSGSDGVSPAFPAPEIEMANLAELNDSFPASTGEYFDISIEIELDDN
jgi:hypothetical protein